MTTEDTTRRDQYSQIKNEICRSDQYLVVGIDVGKDKHHAFMGNTRGKALLRKLVFENNLGGFTKLLEHSEAVRVRNALNNVVFGLEPSGNYHKPLAAYLIGSGGHVVLVAGKAVKSNRELFDGRWDKHDGKDAANVADLVSRGRCQYYDLPPSDLGQLRQVLSLRRRLKKEEHRLRMNIRNNLLAQYFPELDAYYSACESETLAIVSRYLDPRQIAAMQFNDFFTQVITKRRGIAQKQRLQKIYRKAVESVGCPMGPAAQLEEQLLVDKLRQVRSQFKLVEQWMKDIASEFDSYRYLVTIPGFGPFVSSTVIAAIGNPLRFAGAEQVVKFAGYDLSASRSGKNSDRAVAKISKRGHGQLRYALYQAAQVASSRSREFMNYFTCLLHGRERERGIRTKMRVKLAAKMLRIAWVLMKKKQVFNPDYLFIE
jgi:transposase